MVLRYQHTLENDWCENESDVLNAICESVNATKTEVCALVDGLDKYEGKHRNLVACLLALQSRTNMKLILASRPETMLKRLLYDVPSILMQEHNHATIRDYINTAQKHLLPHEASALTPLWESVEREAEGVILWARFVVDELSEQAASGATTHELQDTLQSYPPAKEGVYTRTIARLSPQHKLHAVIAFHCLGLRSTCYNFYVTWSVMVGRLDPDFDFGRGFDQRRLESRIHSMLGGLIEFAHVSKGIAYTASYATKHDEDKCTLYNGSMKEELLTLGVQCAYGDRSACLVRLVHKTLSPFLENHQEMRQLINDHIRPTFGDMPSSVVDRLLIQDAGKDFPADALEVLRTSPPVGSSIQRLCHYMKRCPIPDQWQYRLPYLFRRIRDLPHEDLPEYARSVLEIQKQSFIRWHCVFDMDCRCCEDRLGEHDSYGHPTNTWYLHYLLNHGLFNALALGISDQQHVIQPDARDGLLMSLLERVHPHEPRQHVPGAIHQQVMRLMDLLLQRAEPQPHHVALYLFSTFTEEPQFIARLRSTRPETIQGQVQACPWYMVRATNLLYCWVCSTVHEGNMEEQDQPPRLELLLDLGLSINSKVYHRGTVMHALFDLPHSFIYGISLGQHDELDCELAFPFTRTKFDLIKQAGYDFVLGMKYGSLLERARGFRHMLRADVARGSFLRKYSFASVREDQKYMLAAFVLGTWRPNNNVGSGLPFSAVGWRQSLMDLDETIDELTDIYARIPV